jgi:hypothetical protein
MPSASPDRSRRNGFEHGIGTERHEIGTSPALDAAERETDADDPIVRDLQMCHRGASQKPHARIRLIEVHQAVKNGELRVDGTSRADARRAAARTARREPPARTRGRLREERVGETLLEEPVGLRVAVRRQRIGPAPFERRAVLGPATLMVSSASQ